MMALTRSDFFIEAAPEIPSPPAIDFRSAINIELSPPPRFLGVCDSAAPLPLPEDREAPWLDSMVSVT